MKPQADIVEKKRTERQQRWYRNAKRDNARI
jgi:hypothetical protein